MLSLLIVSTLAVLATVSGEGCENQTCNTNHMKYYKELGCNPVQPSGDCCPLKYDCTSALGNRDPNKCYVRGKSFSEGETVTSEDLGPENACVPQCICTKRGEETTLTCAHNDCPEYFGGSLPGCMRLYSHGRCCSSGQLCSNLTASGKDAFTCDYGGKSYFVGQKFWSDEKPCLSCICEKGFDGTLREPWCKEMGCGLDVHYDSKIKQGCAPIYYGNKRFCPFGWRCPEESDSIVPSNIPASSKDDHECVFGKLRLKVSQILNSQKSCVECKCSLPPHVSCVQTENC